MEGFGSKRVLEAGVPLDMIIMERLSLLPVEAFHSASPGACHSVIEQMGISRFSPLVVFRQLCQIRMTCLGWVPNFST
jgi:hypothetical protein